MDLSHPLVVGAVVVVLTIALSTVVQRLGVARTRARHDDDVLVKLDTYVLPHFVPPTATEIRAGVKDNTIPARQERMELRLSKHLDEETDAAIVNNERVGGIESKVECIEGKLDETLAGLKAGNPEWNPERNP